VLGSCFIIMIIILLFIIIIITYTRRGSTHDKSPNSPRKNCTLNNSTLRQVSQNTLRKCLSSLLLLSANRFSSGVNLLGSLRTEAISTVPNSRLTDHHCQHFLCCQKLVCTLCQKYQRIILHSSVIRVY